MWIYKLLLSLIIISSASSVCAQDTTLPSPEISQMHRFAQTFADMGNLKMAISTYEQLIALVPDKAIFRTELANIYITSGDYAKAQQILEDVILKTDATDVSYQLLAACLSAQKHSKKALTATEDGLARFPSSGILYYQQGLIYKSTGDIAAAVSAWINGINNAPAYAPNYREASLAYLNTVNVLWGLLYGEIYLSMRHRTANDSEMQKALYTGWSKYFNNLTNNELHEDESTFEKTINDIYKGLTPVVSDGMSADNLAMAHTRFLMKWFSLPNNALSFPLFSYQDSLLRNGWFDSYNEQLYGNAESPAQHEAWNKFHTDEMHRFNSWQDTHRLIPVTQPLLHTNIDQELRTTFRKKKKR